MIPAAFIRRASMLATGFGVALSPAFAHAAPAHAFEDTLANALSWVAITVMPLVAIYLFWKIHVLPEVIAEKRHHPQAEAIRVLCLLSLVFGGLLWPLAWLWAYMKPIEVPVVRGRSKRRAASHEAGDDPDAFHGGARPRHPPAEGEPARMDEIEARALASERENAELRARLVALRAQLSGADEFVPSPASGRHGS
ncbi:MAG: DUF3302 domain-containing protein [Pararobbsia sp.]